MLSDLSEADSNSDVGYSQLSNLSQLSIATQVPVINDALKLLNQSPIIAKTLNNQAYLQEKVSDMCTDLKASLGINQLTESEINSGNFLELINRLKIKFNADTTNRSEKIQILTIFPVDWSTNKICTVMGATKHMVNVAKRLTEQNGILSMPDTKLGNKGILKKIMALNYCCGDSIITYFSGRPLSTDTKLKIQKFYIDNEVSINMPGMKDFLSIRNHDGIREHVQKRLILSNLKELFEFFKLRFPDEKIGFSTFASLRPEHCVLAGSSGTHTACVCSVHQNIKLMMLGKGHKHYYETEKHL